MAKTKTAQIYNLLKQSQDQLFADFAAVHQNFALNPEVNRTKFNQLGRDFLHLARNWEKRLCGSMERTNNSVYSAKVSENFWDLIRQDFPLIDQVGVIVKNK